jgi:hypothetical protein
LITQQDTLPAWQVDVITTPPTIETKHARIWRIDLARSTDVAPTAVGVWLLEVPGAHPLWHSYVLSLIHLGQAPDAEPVVLCLPGATHEMALFALNPMHPRQAIFDGLECAMVDPVNFAAQMVVADHAAAIACVERALPLIASGALNPDTDYIRDWVALFGDSMLLEPSIKP